MRLRALRDGDAELTEGQPSLLSQAWRKQGGGKDANGLPTVANGGSPATVDGDAGTSEKVRARTAPKASLQLVPTRPEAPATRRRGRKPQRRRQPNRSPDSVRGQLEQIAEQLRSLQQQVDMLAGQRVATIVGVLQYTPVDGVSGAVEEGSEAD